MKAANKFINFVNKSPSPFHAVDEVKKILNGAGFKELNECDKWIINPLDKFYVIRNLSTIIAFAIGGKYKPGNGFTIIGAHTDSPCLKIKPISKVQKAGYLQVGVQCYGGGLWMTWFDRDLTFAGRVIIKEGDKLKQRLLHVPRPILRIPNLAIHLNREVNDKFSPNKESELCPIIATSAAIELGLTDKHSAGDDAKAKFPINERHHDVVTQIIVDELGVTADQIVDLELCLADTQPACLGGAFNEFIFSPRLDNLTSSFSACQALIESCGDGSLDDESNVRMISLFDNEEVGSESAQGAASTLQELVMRRLCESSANTTAFEESIPRSLLISADMAHAVHPNYSDKHESNHKCTLHKGIVIKSNSNQRYASTALTRAFIRTMGEKAGVPLQDFVVRNDMPCGSTIGPIISAKLGIPTVDVGAPQLSMHSIREMCCTSGIDHSIALFKAGLKHFSSIRDSVTQ